MRRETVRGVEGGEKMLLHSGGHFGNTDSSGCVENRKAASELTDLAGDIDSRG